MKEMNCKEAFRGMIFKTVTLATILVCILLFLGCLTTKEGRQNTELKVEEKKPTNTKSQSLSYGMVTSKVKKGITTQQEILDLFGAPNITTITSEGEESWVYEYTSTSSDTKVSEISKAKQFDLFFGLGLHRNKIEDEKKRITIERSIRTLTVIIKFNPKKTVLDYSARASYF